MQKILHLCFGLTLSLVVSAQEASYQHPDGYFQLQIPAKWSRGESYNGLEFQAILWPPECTPEDPERCLRILFIPLAADADRSALGSRIQDLTQQVTGDLLAEKGRVRREGEVPIGSRAAYGMEVEQVNDHGIRVLGQVLGFVGQSALYFAIFYAPESEWLEFASPCHKALQTFQEIPPQIASSNPSSETTRYVDPEGAFTIDIPINWVPQVSRDQDHLRYQFVPKRAMQLAEQAQLLLFLQSYAAPSAAVPLFKTVQQLEGRLKARDPNLKILERQETLVGGREAIWLTCQAADPSGEVRLKEDVYYLRSLGRIYVVMAAGTPSEYDRHRLALRSVIQSLVIRDSRD